MFAMITEVSDQDGEVSQFTGPIPTACRTALTMPDSLLSIHDQVEADTISGSSQGNRNSARRVGASRKLRLKTPARPSPSPYWNTIDSRVKAMVLHRAVPKVGSCTTCWKLSQPEKGAPP